MPEPCCTNDQQVYSPYRNSVVFVKTLHPLQKHFNRQRWCFFGKNQHWHCYLHSLRRITNISLLHFLFGLCLKTNILFIVNWAHIQLISLRVLPISSLGQSLPTARGCHTVKSDNQGTSVGSVGLENKTCQLFFFLQQGIYEVQMPCRSPVSATAHK